MNIQEHKALLPAFQEDKKIVIYSPAISAYKYRKLQPESLVLQSSFLAFWQA